MNQVAVVVSPKFGRVSGSRERGDAGDEAGHEDWQEQSDHAEAERHYCGINQAAYRRATAAGSERHARVLGQGGCETRMPLLFLAVAKAWKGGGGARTQKTDIQARR